MRDDLVLSQGNTGNEGIRAKRLTWDGEEVFTIPGKVTKQALELEKKGRNAFSCWFLRRGTIS